MFGHGREKTSGILDGAPLDQVGPTSVALQAVACTSAPGCVTFGLARLDCASRFWISACRNACSEADDVLDVPVDVELLLVASLPDVDPVVVVVDVEPVLVAPLLAVEPVAVVDVEAALLEPAGVSALTSAWKSCCSFAKALSPELDEDPADGLDRLCSRC